LTFSNAILSLYIPTCSIPFFRVNIKYFHSLNPTSVLGWFCCYKDLISPVQNGAIKEKRLQRKRNSPQRLCMSTFRNFFFITSSRRLEVKSWGLLGYRREQLSKNTLILKRSQGENCPPKVAPFFGQSAFSAQSGQRGDFRATSLLLPGKENRKNEWGKGDGSLTVFEKNGYDSIGFPGDLWFCPMDIQKAGLILQNSSPENSKLRRAFELKGIVQGVGFRPFVYSLAHKYSLQGWVKNSSAGVYLEVEGPPPAIEQFTEQLPLQAPPRSRIESLKFVDLRPAGLRGFEIQESQEEEGQYQLISPDIATCTACQEEIQNPSDRRYRYPFTNCTNCGPRFTIIEDIPYDRPKTTMARFRMCPECRREYEDPGGRGCNSLVPILPAGNRNLSLHCYRAQPER